MAGGNPKSNNCEPKNDSEFPQWIDFPLDITANILDRLGPIEMLQSAQNVCATWKEVCRDPLMWRAIHVTDKSGYLYNYHKILATYRHAVDLSQGKLVDLAIEIFDDDLLNYILDRSSDLKRLTLRQSSYGLTERGLVEALTKLAHLEEMHLDILPPGVQANNIINISISCPNLKSFTFNQHGFWHESNEYALAIAKSMPNLRHLGLIANLVDNEGLEAILDGCPNLESLDLRQCYNLDLRGGPLAKRCSKQIIHLKFPWDTVSVIDYERNSDSDNVSWAYDEYLSDPYDLGFPLGPDDDEPMFF